MKSNIESMKSNIESINQTLKKLKLTTKQITNTITLQKYLTEYEQGIRHKFSTDIDGILKMLDGLSVKK